MRVFALAAVAAIGLSACNGNNQTQENEAVEESLTANSIVANDVTAIDAVTADAANMAADVDINFTNDQVLYNGGGTAPGATADPGAAAFGTERPERSETRTPSRRQAPRETSETDTPPSE